MTMKEAFLWGGQSLSERGIDDARLDAWYLLEHVTGVNRARYYVMEDTLLTQEQDESYRELIEKRGKHFPLQHLTGEQEFMGLTFKVDENVLIPRQDTEILVEEALALLPQCPKISGKIRLLDLCTGSGCILLSLLSYAAKKKIPVEGTGSDISQEALKIARLNSKNLGIEAEFLKSDLFENIAGKWSMIVSNPPYIKTGDLSTLQEEVRLHDPLIALDGKDDGLYFYRQIISLAGKYFCGRGFLALEIGWDQAKRVEELMRREGYRNICVKKDLAGLDRIVSGVYDKFQ